MTYSTVIFNSIPAVYTFLPRSQKRRTATNIMAGHFDPLPTPPSDYDRPEASSSRSSSVSAIDDDRVSATQSRRTVTKKGELSAHQNGRRGPMATSLPDATLAKGKSSAPGKHVLPHEKENEVKMSDVFESSDSLSPPPPSPRHVDPPPSASASTPVDAQASKPKASGFWRARSSNASDAPTLKRKRSTQLQSEPKPAAGARAAKKPRLSATTAAEPRSRIFDSTSPSLGSSRSLSSETMEWPLPPADRATEQLSQLVATQLEEIHGGPLRCKLCSERFSRSVPVQSLVPHFQERHREYIEKEMAAQQPQQPQQPAPPPPRRRGARKNVAVKKGWKGWVEEDLEPQKLILLDKPEVLPERTTRSGRKID